MQRGNEIAPPSLTVVHIENDWEKFSFCNYSEDMLYHEFNLSLRQWGCSSESTSQFIDVGESDSK